MIKEVTNNSEAIAFILDEQKKQGLNQKEIAIRAGISEATMSRIVNGTHKLKIKTFQRIITALGYTMSVTLKPITK